MNRLQLMQTNPHIAGISHISGSSLSYPAHYATDAYEISVLLRQMEVFIHSQQ